MSSQPIVLHTSPPLAPLPASDSESLYLAGSLQLAAPDKWAVTLGDWSVNGGYQDPDASLSQQELVDAQCWKAYIEQNVTDLVNHTLYSLPPNYPETIAKAQLADLAFPQTQYIPQRLRSIVRSRLQHVGLWGLGGLNTGDAVAEDRKRMDEQYVVGPAGTLAPRAWSGWSAGRDAENRRKKWGEQELQKKIRNVLDPLARRLGDQAYFFGERPTTLDIALFAQLTMLLSPTLPNPLLSDLLRSSYPALVGHHDRILSVLFSTNSWTSVRRIPRENLDIGADRKASYTESVRLWWSGESATPGSDNEKKDKGEQEKSKKDKAFERGRYLWFAGAALSMITYLFVSGMVQIDLSGGDDDDDDSGLDEKMDEEVEGEREAVVLVVDEVEAQ